MATKHVLDSELKADHPVRHMPATPTRFPVEAHLPQRSHINDDREIPTHSKTTVSTTDTPFTRPTLTPTAASTLDPNGVTRTDLQNLDRDDAVSETTSITYSQVDPEDSSISKIPQLGALSRDGQPFECPLCFGIVQSRRQHSWRKHVMSDLRAYVCMTPDCEVGMFEDKNTWQAHDTDCHQRQWNCHRCHTQPFRSANSFQKHLCTVHEMDQVLTDVLTKIISASSQQLLEVPPDCPFCDFEDQVRKDAADRGEKIAPSAQVVVPLAEYHKHLVFHQEQLALFAISSSIDEMIDSGSVHGRSRENIVERDQFLARWRDRLTDSKDYPEDAPSTAAVSDASSTSKMRLSDEIVRHELADRDVIPDFMTAQQVSSQDEPSYDPGLISEAMRCDRALTFEPMRHDLAHADQPSPARLNTQAESATLTAAASHEQMSLDDLQSSINSNRDVNQEYRFRLEQVQRELGLPIRDISPSSIADRERRRKGREARHVARLARISNMAKAEEAPRLSIGGRSQGGGSSGHLADPQSIEGTTTSRGILKKPTEKFPKESTETCENVAPLKEAAKSVPVGARWTKIDRRLVNPEALKISHERFEERQEHVIVLRVLTKDEIQRLADLTRDIRAEASAQEERSRRKSSRPRAHGTDPKPKDGYEAEEEDTATHENPNRSRGRQSTVLKLDRAKSHVQALRSPEPQPQPYNRQLVKPPKQVVQTALGSGSALSIDGSTFSYTDPASMYTDTEPKRRATGPRR